MIVKILTVCVPIVAILSQFIGRHSKSTCARSIITVASVFYCLIGLTANGLSQDKYNEPFYELIYLNLLIMVCLIIVNQGYKWLKVLRPILCALYCICVFVAGVAVLMEGMYGGEEVFNRNFTECSQQEKNEYFNPEHFAKIIGINPPKQYNVTGYETHLYGSDSSTEYTLTFKERLSHREKAKFIDELLYNGFEKTNNSKYLKRTDQEEIYVEIFDTKIIVFW